MRAPSSSPIDLALGHLADLAISARSALTRWLTGLTETRACSQPGMVCGATRSPDSLWLPGKSYPRIRTGKLVPRRPAWLILIRAGSRAASRP